MGQSHSVKKRSDEITGVWATRKVILIG